LNGLTISKPRRTERMVSLGQPDMLVKLILCLGGRRELWKKREAWVSSKREVDAL